MLLINNPPITPRENYIRAAKHRNPLWLPMKWEGDQMILEWKDEWTLKDL